MKITNALLLHSVTTSLCKLKSKKYLSVFAFSFVALNVFCQPVISSFSPASGPVGTSVTITGSGFSSTPSANIVFFGAVKATVQTAVANSLTVTVPKGTTYDPISVTAFNLTAYSNKPFLLSFPDGGSISVNSFDGTKTVSTDLRPQAIVFTDLDGDGLSDVASANNYSITGKPASMSVLRNISTGKNISFEPVLNISSGVLTYTIASGDLNADGKPELVSTSIGDQSIAIFENTSVPGKISFAQKIQYATGENPYSIDIADLNSDGKPDLAVANYFSNTVSVFKNTSVGGVISFASKQDFNTSLSPHGLTIGDIDSDNKPDIVVANELSNTISVLKNASVAGNISFGSRIDFPTGNRPITVSISDLDKDGKDDVAVTNYSSSSFSVLRNTTTGGNILFASKKDFSTLVAPYGVSIADLNGDGMPDVAIAAQLGNLFQNTSTPGNINFATRVDFSGITSAIHMALGDIDGDGKTDIAAGNYTGERIILVRNKSNEPSITSFTPTIAATGVSITITGTNLSLTSSVTIGGAPASSFTIVNSTTITAVVGAASSGDVIVTTPHGTASLNGYIFPGPSTISSFTPTSGTTGVPITITGTNFIGTTEVKFGGIPATSIYVISPTMIKANIGAGASGSISVSNTYGTANMQGFNFTPPPRITSFSPHNGPVGTVVTLNGENFSPSIQQNIVYFGSVKAEVLSANSNAIQVVAPAGITYEPIRLTTGIGGFITQTSEPFTISFAGSNAFASNSFSNGLQFFRGFVNQGAFADGLAFVTADFDNDGKPDIASLDRHNFLQAVSIMRNTSQPDSISFAQPFIYSKEGENIAYGDIDGDGKLDFVTAEQGGIINVFKNTSTPGLISFITKRVDPSVSNLGVVHEMTLGDMDSDGKLDIILLTSTGDIGVLRNTSIEGDISFSKGIVVGYAGYYFVKIADLNGDKKPEIIATNAYLESGISIFENKSSVGNLMFGTRMKIANGFNTTHVEIADLNGDDKPDLTITEMGDGRVSIFENKSDETKILFTSASALAFNPILEIALANDFDGDSKPDLLIQRDKYLSLYKNLSSGGSFSFSSYTGDFKDGEESIGTVDINIDGRPDIVVMRKDSMYIYLNQIGKPINVEVCTNGNITLKSDLPGTNFQWQYNDGTGFKNITDNTTFSGTNSISLKLNNVPANWNGNEFRCIVDNGTASRIFHLIVSTSSDTPSISISASSNSICQGGSITFTATVVNGGSSPSYQWKINGVNVGANSNTFTSNTLNNNDQVSVVLTSNASCVTTPTANSNIITITVDPSSTLTVSTTVSGNNICAGTSVTFTATSTNGGASPTYQWQVNNVNVGTNTNTFTSSTLNNNDQVKVILTSNASCVSTSTATSTPITMIVNASAKLLGKASSPAQACAGTSYNVSFTGTNTPNGSSVQVWESIDNGAFNSGSTQTYNGSALNFPVTGSSGSSIKYFFKILPAANNTCASGNNTDTSVTVIYQLAKPLLTVNANTVSISNPDAGASYKWQVQTAANWADISPVANGLSYTAAISGTYRVRADKGQCTEYSEGQVITISGSTSNNQNVLLYPNPTQGTLTLDSLKLSDNWQILDIVSLQSGQTVNSFNIANQTKVTVHLEALSNGIYLAVLRRKDGSSISIEFVKM